MSRTLILSQEQLNEILGDNVAYLDDVENDVPEFAGHNQVFANSPKGKNITGKDVSNDLGEPDNWLSSRKRGLAEDTIAEVYTKKEFEEKYINEMNQGLNGQRISFNMAGNGNPTDMNTISGNENNLNNRWEKAKARGDKDMANATHKALKTRRDAVNNNKKVMANMGLSNQFQKAGGTKNSGNGKAHTKKMPITKQDNYLGLK